MQTLRSIQDKLQPVFDTAPVYKAIVFGSYANGKATELSDIDIVIDSKGKLIGIDFFSVLDRISAILNIDIDLIEISDIDKNSPLYHAIMQEGITIYDRKVA